MTQAHAEPDKPTLSPAKQALLARRLRGEYAGRSADGAMVRRPNEGPQPLSFAQQRLWFLDQLEPGSPFYNIPAAVWLRGPLDVPAFEQSVNEIVRRHETLRTTFAVADGQPMQVISPPAPFTVAREDLRPLAADGREAEVRHRAATEARRPFDLARGPLLRVTLLQIGEEEYIVFLTMHHIISDGWSIAIFVHELAALYGAAVTGRPSPLAAPAVQYADFARWQRDWLQGAVLQEQIAYWRGQLSCCTPLALPADHAPVAGAYRGDRACLRLSRELTTALKKLGQQEGATLFVTTLAAFLLLTSRYSGQDDVSVGTPVAGRNRLEVEGLIGFFVNTLVLRADLSGEPSFRALIGRVREAVLGAHAHQDVPFEKLVEELQPQRSLHRNPFFDILFNFANTPPATPEIPGLSLTHLEPAEPEARFAWTLYLREVEDTLHLELVYRRAMFDPDHMTVLLGQYQYLLEQAAAAPDLPIHAHSLVTPAARAALPDPGQHLPEPVYEPVMRAFAAWAAIHPDEPAVRQDGHTWSYGELAARARAVASLLRARGLGRGAAVGVTGPRCVGTIAGMLGVLAGGGVLVPIDPRLPAKRRQVMLNEAAVRCLLAVGSAAAGLPLPGEAGAMTVVELDREGPCAGEPGPDAPAEPRGDDAAYIFFTSGSTGTPKAILGCHKGLAHFIHWQRTTFGLGPGDRFSQLTALSFDVVLREILTPLTSGATLCLPREDDLDPGRVLPWLMTEEITVLHAVPAVAQTWLAGVPPGVSLDRLRYVFFAGEPLKESLVRRWRAAFPGPAEIVNLYGPTETTLAKCFYRVPADPPPGIQPIGTPLPETQALVLAAGGRLCGPGEPGEIVLRTPFRALGYLNAPSADRDRFVRNPFGRNDDDLLYHTGDLGRYRPDGTLEILGRLDHQVKVHGARVELGEIEAALTEHPRVREAVVLARERESLPDDCQLLAYVVGTADGDDGRSRELRRFLRERLPEYMVPSAFAFLPALPLLPNGKVDRSALPLPVAEDAVPPESFVPPRNGTEETLAHIWAEVLGRRQVGIHEDFFDLGGHSLLATLVVTRVREAFQVDLPLRVLFEAPTVAQLAERIETVRWAIRGLQEPLGAAEDGREVEVL